ncbi:hypothetical protein NPIL_672161 [Nephila pilipes]|uniref:Uncharacterized protein n=1 Tax=Nephila pilipes TaxID=299642 RepID=A0A8X6NU01_NEPPI|nr:hypothetical protein NPIL_672161 [Nephila pilipes]
MKCAGDFLTTKTNQKQPENIMSRIKNRAKHTSNNPYYTPLPSGKIGSGNRIEQGQLPITCEASTPKRRLNRFTCVIRRVKEVVLCFCGASIR